MRISDNHKHEIYSFNKTTDPTDPTKKIFKIPTEEDINKLKASRKNVLEIAKKGSLAWGSPSGYHFGIVFRKTENGNTRVQIIGRSSAAIGKNPLFKEYEIKGWDIILKERNWLNMMKSLHDLSCNQ